MSMIDPDTHNYKKSTIINKKSDKPAAKKSAHYVDGVKFYEALVARKAKVEAAAAAGLPKPQIDNFIAQCIMDIAKNLSRKYQFSNYHFRDDMVQDAILHCLRYIDSFDITKSANPFSYFTQACYYQFIAKITSEKLHTYIKCKATMHSISTAELSDMDNAEDMAHIHDNLEFDTDFMESFIGDFEAKANQKKTSRVDKPKALDLFNEDN